MTIQEIVNQADREISYPFEEIIEKYLPWTDRISDVVCAGIFLMEDVYRGEKMGPQRKEALLGILNTLWRRAPVPPWTRGVLDKLFTFVMQELIDKLVAWLNAKFPGGILKAVQGDS